MRAVGEQPPSPTSFPLLCLVTRGAPAEAVSMDTGTTQTPSKAGHPWALLGREARGSCAGHP